MSGSFVGHGGLPKGKPVVKGSQSVGEASAVEPESVGVDSDDNVDSVARGFSARPNSQPPGVDAIINKHETCGGIGDTQV